MMTVFLVFGSEMVGWDGGLDGEGEVSRRDEMTAWKADIMASRASSPAGRLRAWIAAFVCVLMSCLEESVASNTSGRPDSG